MPQAQQTKEEVQKNMNQLLLSALQCFKDEITIIERTNQQVRSSVYKVITTRKEIFEKAIKINTHNDEEKNALNAMITELFEGLKELHDTTGPKNPGNRKYFLKHLSLITDELINSIKTFPLPDKQTSTAPQRHLSTKTEDAKKEPSDFKFEKLNIDQTLDDIKKALIHLQANPFVLLDEATFANWVEFNIELQTNLADIEGVEELGIKDRLGFVFGDTGLKILSTKNAALKPDVRSDLYANLHLSLNELKKQLTQLNLHPNTALSHIRQPRPKSESHWPALLLFTLTLPVIPFALALSYCIPNPISSFYSKTWSLFKDKVSDNCCTFAKDPTPRLML